MLVTVTQGARRQNDATCRQREQAYRDLVETLRANLRQLTADLLCRFPNVTATLDLGGLPWATLELVQDETGPGAALTTRPPGLYLVETVHDVYTWTPVHGLALHEIARVLEAIPHLVAGLVDQDPETTIGAWPVIKLAWQASACGALVAHVGAETRKAGPG